MEMTGHRRWPQVSYVAIGAEGSGKLLGVRPG
jgi:hypothetical protein